MKKQKWYVYILQCKDKSYYTGITTDIERRLAEHNLGTGAKYTSARRPCVLKLKEKIRGGRSKATQRERLLKKMTHQEKSEYIKQKKNK